MRLLVSFITLVLPMGILKAAAGMSATVIVGIFAQEIRFIRRMWGMTFMMLAMMMSMILKIPTQEIREMIELIPTKISDFKVNAALLDEADLAIDRMVARCNYLGTKCTADLLRKRIIIRI
jgi:hypothetical protein